MKFALIAATTLSLLSTFSCKHAATANSDTTTKSRDDGKPSNDELLDHYYGAAKTSEECVEILTKKILESTSYLTLQMKYSSWSIFGLNFTLTARSSITNELYTGYLYANWDVPRCDIKPVLNSTVFILKNSKSETVMNATVRQGANNRYVLHIDEVSKK